MRIPNVVLSNLASNTTKKDYKLKDLYRNLYNPEFYLKAYGKIAHNPGNMTPGTDGKTIDGVSLERFNNIIESMKDESYKPNPSRREYITKKDGKSKRPLGIPSFDDKLVQEIVRMILEAIYEPEFKDTSHGFRPNRSCHTALEFVSNNFWSTAWFVEGDIKGFFDNIDHHVLIKILRKKISDERFIRLIWKFLKAGYMEDWVFHKTYSGTPQGGIVSPILANIYLNELDAYMEDFKTEFDKGKRRKTAKRYSSVNALVSFHSKKLKMETDEPQRKKRIQKIKGLVQERRTLPSVEPQDPKFRRLTYVRYADDFLVGIIGSKEDAIDIKRKLTAFLKDKLNLDLSEEKTLITNAKKRPKFLGYEISINQASDVRITGNNLGVKKRSASGKVKLIMPSEVIKKKALSLDVMKLRTDGTYESIHRKALSTFTPLEILMTYNAEIRGLYNYYKLANNVSNEMNNFHRIMEYSMYKTFSSKYKSSVKKVINKYRINGRFAIKYKTTKEEKIMFLNERSYKMVPISDNEADTLPNTVKFTGRTSYEQRLLAEKCHWCGDEGVPIEIHHVKKLKDLKGKKRWEKHMIARKRKTLPLCLSCHDRLHAGKLD